MERKIFIPVILGTTRKGRMSAHVARFVTAEMEKRPNVETQLIDILDLPIPIDDAGETAKYPQFAEACNRADGFIIIAPEYNHAYPGMLKHVLDTNLKEYIHKAVGIVGVSAGPWGGTRVIQSFLPVMRELGLVNIFWDGNFSNVHKAFDESGKLLDESYIRRLDKFIKELIWMSRVLRYGRENISLEYQL
jgi:NAD(P)H-dependent FMN reductase